MFEVYSVEMWGEVGEGGFFWADFKLKVAGFVKRRHHTERG